MSDGAAGAAPASPDAGTGTQGTDPGTQQAEGGNQPQAPVLPVDEFGDYLVPITVNGQEQLVPLSEVRSAHMMHSDYTQKTQELAAQREQLDLAARLQSALERDPVSTLNALAEAYGLTPGGEEAPQGTPAELDPEDAFRQQVEQFMSEQRQREAFDMVETQLAQMKSTHGEFDDNALLQFAVDNGIGDLNVAYQAWAFGQLQQLQPQQPSSEELAQQRKQQLPPVAPGHGAASGAVVPGGAQAVDSVDDAFELAKRSLGF